MKSDWFPSINLDVTVAMKECDVLVGEKWASLLTEECYFWGSQLVDTAHMMICDWLREKSVGSGECESCVSIFGHFLKMFKQHF